MWPHLLATTSSIQIGSPTALADAAVERAVVGETRNGSHGLYVPAGAFWGGQDVQKMADRGTLKVRISSTATSRGMCSRDHTHISCLCLLDSP